jgi:hypothetical protein
MFFDDDDDDDPGADDSGNGADDDPGADGGNDDSDVDASRFVLKSICIGFNESFNKRSPALFAVIIPRSILAFTIHIFA